MILFAILCLSIDLTYSVNAFVCFVFSLNCSKYICIVLRDYIFYAVYHNKQRVLRVKFTTTKNPTQKALDSMQKHIFSYEKLLPACRFGRLMANQIFSFTSYILSELGHRDKLVDVSVWWSDLIQEYMKFMIDFWL